MSRYELLTHSGKIAAKLAEKKALTEFQKYRVKQDTFIKLLDMLEIPH